MKLLRTGPAVSFHCPGCGRRHTVWTEAAYGHVPNEFNNDMERPTFSSPVMDECYTWEPQVTSANLDAWRAAPWVQHKVLHVCHAVITDGRIEFLATSTHEMASHATDLPDWEWTSR